MTLPAGCLKETLQRKQPFFDPPLSDDKRDAIRMTKMGSYKKVFLTFDEIFWPVEPAFLGMVRTLGGGEKGNDNDSNHPLGNYLLLDNLWAIHGVPSIEAVLFGPAGTWATHQSDRVIRDAVLDFIQDAMGLKTSTTTTTYDVHAGCQSCHVTRWEEDPFSRGAYSSMALGALERHKEELRRPEWEGRLIFAGEATVSEFEGSVHAALFSGKSAAEKAHASLLKRTRSATAGLRTKKKVMSNTT